MLIALTILGWTLPPVRPEQRQLWGVVKAWPLPLPLSNLSAETLNSLSQDTASALMQQNLINTHLKNGIVLVNQRVDLLQEQLDLLGQTWHLGCVGSYTGLCFQHSVQQLLSGCKPIPTAGTLAEHKLV